MSSGLGGGGVIRAFLFTVLVALAAGLAPRPEDWKFSSYRYYAGLRRRSLCKKRLARRLLGEGVTMGFSTT